MGSKAIIITARNEAEWPYKTAVNFKENFPDAQIIGVDDGGFNKWPEFVRVIKTNGGVGVGNSRRLGVQSTDADLLLISDGHVLYDKGDIEEAWNLCEIGCIVNSTTKSITTGKEHGNGRIHYLPSHKTKNVTTKEGCEVSMIGGVYFMRKDIAQEIIAPTPNHGSNEQIMTCAAFTFGYEIYALPSFVFSHLYKKKFNYNLTYTQQNRNKKLLDYWFFEGKELKDLSKQEREYKEFVENRRVISSNELVNKIKTMNKHLLSQ